MSVEKARNGLVTRLDQARFRRWFGIHFAAAVAWFLVGVVLGMALVWTVRLEALAEMSQGSSPFPERFTVITIFVNNLIALGIDALGLVSVGLTSVLVLVLNGLLLGAVFAAGASEVSLLLLALLVVPHGIIELSAFWLVAGISFRVYHRLGRYIVGWDETPLTRQEAFEAAVLLGLSVLMILVAAVIEVHLTPEIAELVTGREISF